VINSFATKRNRVKSTLPIVPYTADRSSAIVLAEANTGKPSKGDFESMARRRFQDPTPKREGKWWYLLYWEDHFSNGKTKRRRKRHKLAPAEIPEREARKMAAEFLRPMNQGLAPIGSATKFEDYVETFYKSTLLPLMAASTRSRYEGVIKNYLNPAFGSKCLRDLTPLTLQQYFSSLTGSELSYESRDKIRDVMSSILASSVTYGLLVKNPMEGVRLAPGKKGKRLLAMGIPLDDASFYSNCLGDGAVLLIVHTEPVYKKKAAIAVLEQHGGVFPPAKTANS
jgi:hypothetical protein